MSAPQPDQSSTRSDTARSRSAMRLRAALALTALVLGVLTVRWFWPRENLVRSGVALLAQARLDEAIGKFREAIRLRPDDFEARVNLGIALDRQGNAAVAVLREAIQQNPGYAPAHSALGDALNRMRKLDEAIDEYRKAIQLDAGPTTARASYSLGKALSKQGKFEEAISAYDHAIHASLNDEMVYYDRIDAEHARENASKALAQYQEAVRARPADIAVHKNLLGIALLYQAKLGEANVALREAIRLRPDFAGAHHNLGRTLVRQEKLREAIAEFREAIRLDPADASTREDLKSAMDNLGELDGATAK